MALSFAVPSIDLSGDVLVRRTGAFSKQRMRLQDVQRVVAVSRDAITHEETIVVFQAAGTVEFWISEFDQNFNGVMNQLKSVLPGFLGLEDFVAPEPFEPIEKVLWARTGL